MLNQVENLSHKEIEAKIFHLKHSENFAEAVALIKALYSELEHQKQKAALSDLTLGISHELGQPITNIRYTVQYYRKLFEKTISIDLVFKIFDSILEETERMGKLIKRLAPLTSRQSIIEQFDLMNIIQNRVKAESTRLQNLKIQVKISPSTPIYMVGDAVKFEQIISNLLFNAIDAISENKQREDNQIDIQVKEKDDEIKMTFKDTGIGISAKNKEKIFEPFFTSKLPGKGEGLGLFIVWNILKMQGGQICLDTQYKEGASFLIAIPKTNINYRDYLFRGLSQNRT
jgi:C4-dicarboxylate-specific signal transduction histidine kinase